MLLGRYTGEVGRFAFREFAVRTDLTYGLISLVAAIVSGPKDKPLGDLTTSDLGLYAAYTLGVYLAIRLLVVGPYYVWREQYLKVGELEQIYDNPVRLEREAFAKIRAKKKFELIAAIRELYITSVEERPAADAMREVARLEPQAIPDGSLHTDIKTLLDLSLEFKSADRDDDINVRLRNTTEKLTREIHQL